MKLRPFLILAGFVGLMVLILVNLGQVNQFFSLLRSLRPEVLLLVIPIQAASYLSYAKFYQQVLRSLGHELPIPRLYELTLATAFVNVVFPSGGVSGSSFLAAQLTEVPVGKSTLIQLLRYGFTYLSFLSVMALGFLLLFLGGSDINRVTVRATLLLILILVTLGLVGIFILSDRARTYMIVAGITGFINRLYSKFRHRLLIEDTQVKYFVDEFHQGYQLLLSHPSRWGRPALFTLGANLAEVLTIYVVFLAFGAVINPGAIIAAYALANIFSTLSIFTSGVGVYEATMTATLVALGVPLALSLSAVLVYRVFNFWLFLPVGFFFYRKRLSSS